MSGFVYDFTSLILVVTRVTLFERVYTVILISHLIMATSNLDVWFNRHDRDNDGFLDSESLRRTLVNNDHSLFDSSTVQVRRCFG